MRKTLVMYEALQKPDFDATSAIGVLPDVEMAAEAAIGM